MNFGISPRRTCNQCGYTMKISSMYHRHLIYDVKRTTEIDGMGPFKGKQSMNRRTEIMEVQNVTKYSIIFLEGW